MRYPPLPPLTLTFILKTVIALFTAYALVIKMQSMHVCLHLSLLSKYFLYHFLFIIFCPVLLFRYLLPFLLSISSFFFYSFLFFFSSYFVNLFVFLSVPLVFVTFSQIVFLSISLFSFISPFSASLYFYFHILFLLSILIFFSRLSFSSL